MAATWMKAIHRSGGSVAAALGLRIGYAQDVEKTDGGVLIDSYECEPYTAQSEFLFSKRLYAQKTGRDQGKHDVIAYHIRMSFRPGEVTAERALELGKELALRWTKGKHQFIVASHTNTNNPHAHIVFNSVSLDCDRKFEDFKRSAIALRRVSDRVCLEHGLSIIEKPGLSKGYNHAEYMGERKSPTVRDRLRGMMDAALIGCNDFDGFIVALHAAGVEVKRGKQLAFKLPGGKKFVRQDTLGGDYSVSAILKRISGKRVAPPKQKNDAPVTTISKPNLLIDIEKKIRQGYGEGYRRWAAVFNLKEAARTLIFLQERGLDDYAVLTEKADIATNTFNIHNDRRNEIEVRLKEITSLQKHIGIYSKTREVYKRYRTGGWNRKFYVEHQAEIDSHRAAKKVFDALGLKKLPPMDALRKEYATLDAERKKLSRGYRTERDEMTSLLMAKQNVDRILDGAQQKLQTHHRDLAR